jgi:hypothetical protein
MVKVVYIQYGRGRIGEDTSSFELHSDFYARLLRRS